MDWGLALLGLGLGLGLVVIGGGIGIGLHSKGALEGMARQPEAAGMLRMNTLVFAALIEAFTFLAIILVFLLGDRALKKEAPSPAAPPAAVRKASE